jgi:uncharacterized FlaG/YvyC family protein
MDILIQKAVDASMQPQPSSPNKVQGDGNGEGKPYVPAVVTKERMEEISERVQEHLENRNISIAFSTYGDNGEKISITVKEKDTGKVIREIPAEEFQRLYSRMNELMGMIFDEEF